MIETTSRVIRGDVTEVLAALRPEDVVVDAIVTSPPYLKQRRYGDDPRALGREETVGQYATNLAHVIDDAGKLLAPGGLCWLNIGDKANGSGGAGGDWGGSKPRSSIRANGGPGPYYDPSVEEGSYVDAPGAVLRELLDLRWRLRMPIVWDKGRESPEALAHVRRPRWSHEMIFLLTPHKRTKKKGKDRMKFYPSGLVETGSVWHFPPGGSGPAHLAPFPDELARRCIAASTLPGDTVLDIFHGSGTTGRVANAMGRHYVGIDLYAGEPLPFDMQFRRKNVDVERIKYSAVTADGTVEGTIPGKIRLPVDLGEMSTIGFRPAVFYYAARLIVEAEKTLDEVQAELGRDRMTEEQIAYLEERLP